MEQSQYGILRFAKYKGPEIGRIEAHNERTKEVYASNPDVDVHRSKYNLHLVAPQRSYRAEAERQIAHAGCRSRSDSVRVVEVLVTASHDFFKGKKKHEIKDYFQTALDFLRKYQQPETIFSAVIHMDEKTPHMHLCFVPLTEDGRLCARDIVGNRKKLVWWQDEFYLHMSEQYPELERGESAASSGRQHITTRLYKEAAHLGALQSQIMELLSGSNVLNAASRARKVETLLEQYLPGVEQMKTRLKKYDKQFKALAAENQELEQKLRKSEDARRETISNRLKYAEMEQELRELHALVDHIPPEILQTSKTRTHTLETERI